MRSTAALLLLCAAAAFSETYGWVRSGDRYENPAILALLLESDLDAADAVAAALSERTDGYVEDIIAGLLYQHSPRADLLLAAYLSRVTLARAPVRAADIRAADSAVRAADERGAAVAGSGGPADEGAVRARLWAQTNPAAVRRLLEALPSLHDGHARAAVLRLLPHAAAPEARSLLASELAALAGHLRECGGHSAGGKRRELFAAMAAAELTGGHELAPALIEISRRSRDAEVVAEARRLAAKLLRDDSPQ